MGAGLRLSELAEIRCHPGGQFLEATIHAPLLLVREAGPVAARALAQNYGSRLERR